MKKFYILISLILCVFLLSNVAKPQDVDFNDNVLNVFINYTKKVKDGQYRNGVYNPVPPGWEFTISDKIHYVSVFPSADPNLCGIPIQPGDYIGLFYIDENGEEKCGGCQEWIGVDPLPLLASGNDIYTNEKDGFYYNEYMKWYVYMYSLGGKVFPAIAEFEPGLYGSEVFKGTSTPGLSIVKESVSIVYPNYIIIPKGWSGMSSYTKTNLFPPYVSDVLDPISSELIIIKDMTKVYWPGTMNNMMFWTNGKGYKIKMAEEAVLPMKGCPVDSRTVSLSTTWNILPVLSECNVLASTLFSPILNKIIVVKEIAGNKVFWPDMGIETLQVLEPGKAYYIAVSQNTPLTYEECLGFKDEIVPQETEMINLTPWNTPVETGFTHTIALSSEALTQLQEGDFIGAFTQNDYCAGLVEINNAQKNIPITVYGDDITTPETDGLSEGEQIIFKVFKTTTNEEANMLVEYNTNYASSDGNFYDNGLSVVNNLKLSSTGISTLNNDVNFYPNPTNGIVEVSVENEGNYFITVQTLNGQVIAQQNISGNTQFNLSDCSKGIYVVIIENDSSRRVEKLIIK